ncbi:MAG: hypothetical protein FJY54_12420 [Betaproteobacteria bacterium]|nr:hypothetical protein [Betaproteobacteria bacterium]
MKLLFDQNLSPVLVEELHDLFPGSAHTEALGLNRHIRLRRPAKREYSLDELVAGIRRANLHGEVEFGAPEGREAF